MRGQSLFEFVSKATRTTVKRLTVDLQTVKDAYKSFEVNDVVFVRSENKIADALIKLNAKLILHDTVTSGKILHSTRQWIIN